MCSRTAENPNHPTNNTTPSRATPVRHLSLEAERPRVLRRRCRAGRVCVWVVCAHSAAPPPDPSRGHPAAPPLVRPLWGQDRLRLLLVARPARGGLLLPAWRQWPCWHHSASLERGGWHKWGGPARGLNGTTGARRSAWPVWDTACALAPTIRSPPLACLSVAVRPRDVMMIPTALKPAPTTTGFLRTRLSSSSFEMLLLLLQRTGGLQDLRLEPPLPLRVKQTTRQMPAP